LDFGTAPLLIYEEAGRCQCTVAFTLTAVSQCHSEPQAKNLLCDFSFGTNANSTGEREKSRSFAIAQDDNLISSSTKHGGAFSLCHSEELRDEESAFEFSGVD
jgi:hypothetical protein